MDNVPEAAPQNVGTEATTTNDNSPAVESTTQQQEQQINAEQVAKFFGTSADNINELTKFMDANGKFDKAFKTFKERISNPAPETKEEPKTPEPVQPQMTVEEQAHALQTPAGYMSPQEFMATQYYSSLASQDEYKAIADDIRSGEVFKEMAKFGIRPMDPNGNLNDSQVRAFLDLKAKTVPAAPAKTPEASQAPTVDYIPTNQGKIDNAQQAMQIIAQSASLKAKGLAEHPDNQAALDFLKNAWKK